MSWEIAFSKKKNLNVMNKDSKHKKGKMVWEGEAKKKKIKQKCRETGQQRLGEREQGDEAVAGSCSNQGRGGVKLSSEALVSSGARSTLR